MRKAKAKSKSKSRSGPNITEAERGTVAIKIRAPIELADAIDARVECGEAPTRQKWILAAVEGTLRKP